MCWQAELGPQLCARRAVGRRTRLLLGNPHPTCAYPDPTGVTFRCRKLRQTSAHPRGVLRLSVVRRRRRARSVDRTEAAPACARVACAPTGPLA